MGFSKYFEEEVRYLREVAGEFAKKYPAVAPLLADRSGDPDVQRLLEGTAFLTARIRAFLDDDHPELLRGFVSVLHPQLLRALPSVAIVELQPRRDLVTEPRRVERGQELGSVPVGGHRCRFRTTATVNVQPIAVRQSRLELGPHGGHELRVDLQAFPGIERAVDGPLRLHFTLDPKLAFTLRHWCLHRTTHVELLVGSHRHRLQSTAVQPWGLDDDSSLLPTNDLIFPGLTLIQEYLLFPWKFAFIEVDGVADAWTSGDAASLLFCFHGMIPQLNQVPGDSIRVNCVPAVNLFKADAEPIRVDPKRTDYLLSVAGVAPDRASAWSVEQVIAVRRGASERLTLPPFERFLESGEGVNYELIQTPSTVSDFPDNTLRINGIERLGEATLSVSILGTNGALAAQLRPGDVNEPVPTTPPWLAFRNVGVPTQPIPPRVGTDLGWQLAAHTSAGLHSLISLDRLRPLLLAYEPWGELDVQASRANHLRMQGVRGLSASGTQHVLQGSPVRGIALDLTLDESQFAGDGDAVLFAQVLERFFAEYASINSFVTMRLRLSQSNESFSWPARLGSKILG